MKKIRKNKRVIAMCLALLQLIPCIMPMRAFALTGGPSAPEVQQFSPAENTELVNLFTGSFNYQIPLLDVGGYPLTLSYSSNVGMESEASMVGLGWNLNTGSVTRNVRGLPDDFNGDAIEVTKSAQPRETIAFGAGLDLEILGADAGPSASGNISAKLGMEHSTYDGWSAEVGFGGSMEGSIGEDYEAKGKLGVGITGSSSDGSTINFSVDGSFGKDLNENESYGFGASYGLAVNSRAGMKEQNFGGNISYKNTSVFGRGSGLTLNKQYGIDKGEFTAGGEYRIGYSSPSMSPSIDWPMYKDGFTGALALGGEIGGSVALTGSLEFKYGKSGYAKNFERLPAYGYMYAQNASGNRDLLDVQREKDGDFSKEIPNLPMAQFTHDIFSVNAQGISTDFRPFRGDAGTLCDPATTSNAAQGGIGAEIAAGDLAKVGVNIKIPIQWGWSGKWRDGNNFNEGMSFKTADPAHPLFEPVYFKSMGEAVAMANENQFNAIGGFAPVRTTVNNDGTNTRDFTTDRRNTISYTPESLVKQNREPRQNNMQFLTAMEAQFTAFSKEIVSYPLNTFNSASTSLDFNRGIRKSSRLRYLSTGHNISEIKVTRTDGMRFVFGIPATNTSSTDVTFNISARVGEELRRNKKTGLVRYTPNEDNTVRNSRGENHIYEKERTPASTYAWMLTDMLSPDYVDLTGDGTSPDDLGTYTKFNYSQATDHYYWRVPYPKDSATYKGGSKSNDQDDVANYSFGSKELWYMHSIETKNYIAEFTYSNRDDAVGTQGENGGLSTSPEQRMKRLDKIELYTKASRMISGAVPVQSVHFVYDYSLCKSVPNNINGGGKLTLKRIWFEYGSSERGSRNPYLFSYSDFNPNYHPKKFDRWGNYIGVEEGEEDGSDDGLKSYAALSRETADRFARAWLLNKITTPAGSVLNVEYETNDYAYVQNLGAMEHVKVVGFANQLNKGAVAEGGEIAELYGAGVNNYVQFKLKRPLENDVDLQPYVTGVSELYFSMSVRLSNPTREEAFEKVEGFIPVGLRVPGRDFGLCNNRQFGWLRLPQISNGDDMADRGSFDTDMSNPGVHPISKAAWETIRNKFSNLMYPEAEAPHSPEAMGTALANCFASMAESFVQVNDYLKNGSHANAMKKGSAKIRLQSPDKIKFGGGARVKKIFISDEWGNMVQDPSLNFKYGKEYTYTATESEKTISSGVAAYEPASGNDENPFVVPFRYSIVRPLSVGFNLYQTGPVGQIYFPAPVIGYSRVTVKEVQLPGAPATGYSVNEFYTGKDFPTIVTTTNLNVNPREIQFPPFYNEDHLNAAQGFTVELNDMHGKQKSIYAYPPTGSIPVSGALYHYKTDVENRVRLNNEVSTVNGTTGDIRNEQVGVDYEFFADAREHFEHNMLPSVDINLDISIRGPLPIIIPTVYPGYSHSFERLRTITHNKVIYRCGLLEETETFNNGAIITTHNLLRDHESGEVVLQSVENEFSDNVHQLTYPARWITANNGMNGAYRNAAVELRNINVTTGVATISSGNIADYLTQGDELTCIELRGETLGSGGNTYGATDEFTSAWVMSVNRGENKAYLIDRKGEVLPTDTYTLRVLRSGYRNIINEPAAKFSMLHSPVNTNRLSAPTVANGILSAQVSEFDNEWQTYGLFESAPPVYHCACSHNQIVKRNAVDLLGELVNTLLTRGDNKRNGVAITNSYSTGAAFLSAKFAGTGVTYDGELSGSVSRGFFTPTGSRDPANQCELIIRMADGSTFFPDSILAFTIDSRSFDDGDGDCNDIYTATGTITYLGQPTLSQIVTAGVMRPRLTARVTISSCIPLANCESAPSGRGAVRCLASGHTTINPFVTGVLGTWRPLATYLYPTSLDNGTTLRSGGTYASFENYFTNFPLRKNFSVTSWKPKDRLTVCDPFGKNLESKDAVNNYSSQVFGYGFSLPVAVAGNARHANIAFDGFEDYQFKNQITNPFTACPLLPHFKAAIEESDVTTRYTVVSNDVSHTGSYCLALNETGTYTRNFSAQYDRPAFAEAHNAYHANNSVLIPTFTPSAGTYYLSAWMKKDNAGTISAGGGTGESGGGGSLLNQISQQIFPGTIPLSGIGGVTILDVYDIVVKLQSSTDGASSTVGSFTADKNAVDGWVQINGKFTVPENISSITIELRANNTKTYFDDLRVQPYNSVMKAYVYDPLNMRMMAELDENNYATMYVYDQQGKLVATKKETEKGIFTVQEVRNGTSKITRP